MHLVSVRCEALDGEEQYDGDMLLPGSSTPRPRFSCLYVGFFVVVRLGKSSGKRKLALKRKT